MALAARRALVRDARPRACRRSRARVRTPFQRDRDRLVHSKPFRRLKGKTQVFIDPEGDHYRTRMTHTLETTAISRVVARALRLNEDLVEAIGLGHDTGPHAVRPRRRAGARRRAQRAVRPALPSQRAVAGGSRGGSTSPTRSATASSPTRARRSRRRSRARSSASSTGSPTSTTTSTTRSATGSSPSRDLPRAEIELLGATGSERIDRLVHDLVETSEQAGDIRQSDEIGEAMLSLRAFMFDRVYLGPAGRARAPARARRVHAIFARLVADPELLPPGEGDLAERITDYVSGMTDRFALAYAAALVDGADQGPERARRRRRRRTSSTSSGCGRRCARARARATWAAARSTTSARRASRSTPTSTSTTASAAARAATSSRSSARPRASTSSARSSGSPSGSGSRSSTRRARRRPTSRAQAARAALRGARPGGGVLRAPPLGGRRRGARARLPREPRPRRGGREGVPARASRRATGSRRRRARRDSPPTSCAPPG